MKLVLFLEDKLKTKQKSKPDDIYLKVKPAFGVGEWASRRSMTAQLEANPASIYIVYIYIIYLLLANFHC